jgi:hypothetical protein
MGGREVLAFVVVVVVGTGAALYEASSWWERAYATFKGSELSPDGCIRIDTYEPFWITPTVLHRIPHPDPESRNDLGMIWNAAIFRRAYEASTGAFLGQTVAYDPSSSFNLMSWNEAREPGRRVVLSDGFPFVDTDRCADAKTLARLEAYHEQRRKENRAMQEAWEEERERANPVSGSRR